MPLLTPAQVAIIFDLDNTLITSRIDFRGLRRALIDLLHADGVTTPHEDLMRLPIPHLVATGEARGADLGKRMWEVVLAFEREGMVDVGVMDHARDVLSALRALGYRLALLTNNSRPATEEAMGNLGLTGYFEVIATRDDVSAPKPAPDGVMAILAHLGPSVRRSYVIGDAWIDGLAAEAAGARFIVFGERAEDARARGVHPWASVADLRRIPGLDLRGD
ncbi:MAG: HAD family hydrolase [Armatimonadetes bacterium]|nr:HAD family hydrolase [Armatimonadota bacterium]